MMRTTVTSLTRKMAVAWRKEFRRCMSSMVTRATGKDKQSSQILLSPPLVSLDFPEVWASSSDYDNPPSGHEICKNLLHLTSWLYFLITASFNYLAFVCLVRHLYYAVGRPSNIRFDYANFLLKVE